jgi:dipeptidase
MCDTFFISKEFTLNGNNIFAKNSDREPNEAQQIQRFPSVERTSGFVKCTFITVPFVGKTNEIIVSKPFQMWGVEMGINEFGLAIGNEAVFTKIKSLKSNTGLTGMDMNRLVLETCKTAKEGLQFLIFLLEKYGQDACGGYTDRGFFYDNSFLVADANEAFVLETAGSFWAYQRIKGFRAISNRLTIETEFDGIHVAAQDFALKKGWVKRQEKFSFAKAFNAPLMTMLARGKERKILCETKQSVFEKIDLFQVFQILRSHNIEANFHPSNSKMDSLCLHASGLLTPSQTTGSMAVELEKNAKLPVWLTGSSAPCLSVFKPFYFDSSFLNEENFCKPSPFYDESYWWKWEKWHRLALEKYGNWASDFTEERDDFEKHLIASSKEQNSKTELYLLSEYAIKSSLQFIEKWVNKIKETNSSKKSWLYNFFWKRLNKMVKMDL